MGKIVKINTKNVSSGECFSPDFVYLEENFGILGDAHANKDSIFQISMFSKESLDLIEENHMSGLCIKNFVPNFVTSGVNLTTFSNDCSIVKIGSAEILITKIGKACHFSDGCNFSNDSMKCIMPKECVFAKVIKSGVVSVGDEINVIDNCVEN